MTQGGDSIDILGMKLGTKLGAILGPVQGARPNIVPSFEPNFVSKMSIESPPRDRLIPLAVPVTCKDKRGRG